MLEQTINNKPVVLVVDDTPANLALVRGLLRQDYRTLLANGGEAGLRLARDEIKPDVILLDVMMPVIDGYEVCRQLKADPATADIPIIFLTAKNEIEDEEHGLQLGAVDYITKPISPPILLARLQTHILLKKARDFLRNQNAFLEQEVAARTQEVVKRSQEIAELQDVTIFAMASLAEARDNETGNHIRRTQQYVRCLAEKLRELPEYQTTLSDELIDKLFKSAPLHDIGKIGIPDHILLKPGKLTVEEFDIMKTHAVIGSRAIQTAEGRLKISNSFLHIAAEIAGCHHEKWDGSGYPNGMVGKAIPFSARLMAVADVYDALISARVYKPAFPHEKAISIIVEGRGTHFDPEMVDVLLDVQETFRSIAIELTDNGN